jgi:hypothetical protein
MRQRAHPPRIGTGRTGHPAREHRIKTNRYIVTICSLGLAGCAGDCGISQILWSEKCGAGALGSRGFSAGWWDMISLKDVKNTHVLSDETERLKDEKDIVFRQNAEANKPTIKSFFIYKPTFFP